MFHSGTFHGQLKSRTRIAPQVFAYFLRALSFHVLSVDGQNQVASFHSGFYGRAVFLGFNNHHPVFFLIEPDHRPDSGIFPGSHLFQLIHSFFRIIHGKRIHLPQHGIYSPLYHRIGRQGIDVEHIQLLINVIKDFQIF